MTMKTLFAAGIAGLMGMGMARACSLTHYTGSAGGVETRATGRTMDLTEELGVPVTAILRIVPKGIEYDGSNYANFSAPIVNPVKWTAKYGCLTIDDLSEGFNEKGLSVDMLYLGCSQYQADDGAKPGITHLKVLRYLLTQAATVSEALALFSAVNVVGEHFKDAKGNLFLPGLHWALRDANNDMAIVEFVNAGSKRKPKSKMIVYHGTDYDTLTNDPVLSQHLKNFKRYARGKKALGGDFNAMDRFVRLKMYKKTLPARTDAWTNVSNVFQLMDNVHTIWGSLDYARKEKGEEWPNVWTTVMDHNNKIFYLRQAQYPSAVWVDLNKIDFATLDKIGILDPKSFELTGDVTDKFTWSPPSANAGK